jgi:hypothetical protein
MDDHDQRFKRLIQMFLAELFEGFFPQWFGRFDFPGTTWLDQEVFLDPPQGERRVIDLVARLPLRPRPGETAGAQELALIHIEVEAEETTVPLRRRFYESYRERRRKHGLPVLPIAVFLRVGLDGNGVLCYEEKFDELLVLSFTFEYIGLPALDAEAHLNGLNMLAVALSALMRAPRLERERLAAEALRRIEESNLDLAKKYLLGDCIKAYAPLTKEQWQAFDLLIRTPPYRGVLNMTKTWAEEGEERGILKGERRLVQRLLEKRFGRLSPAVEQRVAEFPLERIEAIGEALLTAASLRELGLED